MRILLFLSLAFCLSLPAKAQHYKTAAGLRIGNGYGLTVVQTLSRKWTGELLLHNNFQMQNYASVMARRHHSLMLLTRSANFYYGGGVHAGFGSEAATFAGLNGVLGAEVTLFHVNMAFDFNPHFDLGQENWFRPYFGLSARYVIVEANWKSRWQKQRKKRQRKRTNYKGR
ncbi:MAG: hypothetical protein AAF927_02620 [Bacteroidota bacterium]